jgi:hypothetical protein
LGRGDTFNSAARQACVELASRREADREGACFGSLWHAFVGDDFRAAGRSYSSVMLDMREYEDWQALGRDLIARGLAASVLDALNTELVIVGVDEALLQRAGALADERALRGHEAVHLASALALGPGETILVTGDRDLSNAAVGAGLAIAPAR